MGRLLRETGEGTIKTNTHHTPRVHSDDTDEFVRESVRRFFKSLSTRGVFSLMRNGVVCFMIDMSNVQVMANKQGYDTVFQPSPICVCAGNRYLGYIGWGCQWRRFQLGVPPDLF